MGNCLPLRRNNDEQTLLAADRDITRMGASQSSSSSSSLSSNVSQPQPSPPENTTQVQRSSAAVNSENTAPRAIRIHGREGRPRPTSAYVNELYVTSTLSINDEAQIHAQIEEKRKARSRGLLQQLRIDVYMEGQVEDECAICMIDFEPEEEIRRLPCNHVFHLKCIDDWLLRSFICPSCMEPVDSALLAAFTPKQGIDLASISFSPASLGSSSNLPCRR